MNNDYRLSKVMQRENPNIVLRLSLQNALLGEITANIFAVGFRIKEKNVEIHAFFYETPTEEEIENFSCVITEVIADMPEDYIFDEKNSVYPCDDFTNMDFMVFKRA